MVPTPKRGRLLFLAPVVPADRGNGVAMRVGFFLDAYAHRFDVDLAVFPIAGSPAGPHSFLLDRVRRAEVFPRPARDSHLGLVLAIGDSAARLAAFRQYARPSLAGFAGEVQRRTLDDWIGDTRYDVVHVARLYFAPLAERWTSMAPSLRPRLVIDCDEDDSNAYRRLAAIERRSGQQQKAAWAEAEADAFARLADLVLPRFDQAFAASTLEARSLSARGARVIPVPNVAPAAPRRTSCRLHRTRTVLFVGTMGYRPNDDAARWLVTRIWPRLCRAVRGPLWLVLVGSNPSPALLRLAAGRNVLVTGTVADVDPFYRNADLAVVPIRAGGGTRIKILEAAAWGVPIVSTRLGAEGTTFRHGRDLLFADDEEQFVRACTALLQHPGHAQRLAARARLRVTQDYHAGRWAKRVGALAVGWRPSPVA